MSSAPIPFGPARRQPRAGLLIGLLIAAAATGLLAGHLVLAGHGLAIAALAVVFLPVVMWRRPETAPVVMLLAALLIEQYHDTIDALTVSGVTPPAPITSSIPLFAGIGSLHIEPADLLLLLVFIIFLAKSEELGSRSLRSPLGRSLACVMAMVVVGVLIGAAHHFNLRVALQESRPYVYLVASFALTALLIRRRAAIETMLWAFVFAEAIKSLQGLIVYLDTRSWPIAPEAVLGHEEAYFFGVYILLVAALWLFEVRGPLRLTATWLLPLIVFADLVNNRRASWLILGGGMLALAVIGYALLPERRRAMRRLAAVLVLAGAVYLPVFWNDNGSLGEPARAVKSIFSPDPRDKASNLYRVEEDANLVYNIHQGGLIGKGFGVPIDYALPIVNIQSLDPDILYIPHNGVLYQLMRMGVLGGLAVWSMLGCGIVAGCRLARAPDRLLAVVGVLTASALVGYALEGATDQGFYFYRIAFVTGALLGLTEAARHLAGTGGEPAGLPAVAPVA